MIFSAPDKQIFKFYVIYSENLINQPTCGSAPQVTEINKLDQITEKFIDVGKRFQEILLFPVFKGSENVCDIPHDFEATENVCDIPHDFEATENVCDIPHDFQATENVCDIPHDFQATKKVCHVIWFYCEIEASNLY